jgi:hypothetical protein
MFPPKQPQLTFKVDETDQLWKKDSRLCITKEEIAETAFSALED